ncbi:hypothetical protein [Salsuginibacillus kocurii]|uniref:hypothetical protein n=1 Tax=Salsuginibacillus kocurii TaxID=427078 RepID=UPI00035D56D4|nr:hypothetical protein [Salsuginibacillus kocurii]
MPQRVHIFMEYKIKKNKKQVYEAIMSEALQELNTYSIEDYQWFEAMDQEGLYVEMFSVETMAMYEEIKNARTTLDHPFFSQWEDLVEGGLRKVHCWAFLKKDSKDSGG